MFFGVHVFLSTTRGKLLRPVTLPDMLLPDVSVDAPVHQFYFFIPLFYAVGPCLFLFFLKQNITGPTRYFILRFGFGLSDRLCRGTIWPSLGFVWHDASRLTHDDHLYYLPSRLLLYMALVRTATRPFFYVCKRLWWSHRSVENKYRPLWSSPF